MEQKNNNFFKLALLCVMIFIAWLIVMNFIHNKYEITTYILICLAFMIVILLSDTFDNFSVGKILTLKRNIKDITKEKEDLKLQNSALLNKIITNNTIYNQFMSGSNDIRDLMNKKENDETELIKEDKTKISIEERRRRRKYNNILEILTLKEAMQEIPDNVDKNYDIKIINNNYDGIMNKELRFDAVAFSNEANIFYEVKKYLSIDLKNDLFYMLDFIKKYKEISKKSSKLVLIIPIVENDNENIFESERNLRKMKYLEKEFELAIKSNIFEIRIIHIDKEIIDSEYKKTENK